MVHGDARNRQDPDPEAPAALSGPLGAPRPGSGGRLGHDLEVVRGHECPRASEVVLRPQSPPPEAALLLPANPEVYRAHGGLTSAKEELARLPGELHVRVQPEDLQAGQCVARRCRRHLLGKLPPELLVETDSERQEGLVVTCRVGYIYEAQNVAVLQSPDGVATEDVAVQEHAVERQADNGEHYHPPNLPLELDLLPLRGDLEVLPGDHASQTLVQGHSGPKVNGLARTPHDDVLAAPWQLEAQHLPLQGCEVRPLRADARQPTVVLRLLYVQNLRVGLGRLRKWLPPGRSNQVDHPLQGLGVDL
mmetsp:Transcript_61779/g.193641  ORF Transcript_61779/g.193641 Transcript_61779/m.193641 type:complete len:306 (+) Transcript_61779:809-1726(+)